MTYSVKEIFLTLQGEGAQAGRAAVFCRFSGCNLWSGRETDRAQATCRFCDTDFRGVHGPGGGKFTTADELADRIRATWPRNSDPLARPLVVCTGGEPLLQLDPALIDALHHRGFAVAVETNGTCPAPSDLDWICVSPKGGTEIHIEQGNELKLVYPQANTQPEQFEHLDFTHFFLQPMDGPELAANTEEAIAYCLRHPRWRLSPQMHKLLGIP